MRRGIATFGLVSRLVPTAVTLGALAVVCLFPFGVALVVVLAWLMAAVYGEGRARQWRRLVRSLSVAERAALHAPLRSAGKGDTRKTVAPLIRELRVATEVTPSAAAPTGRGDGPTLAARSLP